MCCSSCAKQGTCSVAAPPVQQAFAAYRWHILDLLHPISSTQQQLAQQTPCDPRQRQEQEEGQQSHSTSSLTPPIPAPPAAAAATAAAAAGVPELDGSLIPPALNRGFVQAVRSWCAKCPGAAVLSKPSLRQQHRSLQRTVEPLAPPYSSSSSRAYGLSRAASNAAALTAPAGLPAGLNRAGSTAGMNPWQQQQEQQRLFVLQPRPSWEQVPQASAADGAAAAAAAAAAAPALTANAQEMLDGLQEWLSTRKFYRRM
jgi:hypothetical protein